jgi:hypothetical protein
MRENKISKYGAIVVYEATKSLHHFNNEVEQTELLMFFILIADEYISDNKEKARLSLISIYDDPDNEVSKKLVGFFKSEQADKLFDMMFYERHFSQMAYSRSIDNFISYFKDILAEVVIKKPQILKSKDQERLDFILNHNSMEDLLKSISERKIEELFYKGIIDIEKFFDERLGIRIFKDDETKGTINRLIKQRNLIVHNRGQISKEFAADFPEMNYQSGLYLVFEYEQISKTNLYLCNFLVELDTEIADKFDLELTNGQ